MFPQKHFLRTDLLSVNFPAADRCEMHQQNGEEPEARAQRREGELKVEMHRRVQDFVDCHGHRPQLAEINGDEEWRAIYDELNALRTRDGKHTHARGTQKKPPHGSLVPVELPSSLPEVPAGVKDGQELSDGADMALPAALHLCFPDLFPTMTAARRSARRGGDPKIYRAPAGIDLQEHARETARSGLGQELTCKDRVRAGEQLLLHFRRAPPSEDGCETDFAMAVPPVRGKRVVHAAVAGNAAAQAIKVALEDEHMAIVVKPPSLLTIPHGAGCTMDVKTLLPKFLNLPPPSSSAGRDHSQEDLSAYGIEEDAVEILRGCGVVSAVDVLHIEDDDAKALGLSPEMCDKLILVRRTLLARLGGDAPALPEALPSLQRLELTRELRERANRDVSASFLAAQVDSEVAAIMHAALSQGLDRLLATPPLDESHEAGVEIGEGTEADDEESGQEDDLVEMDTHDRSHESQTGMWAPSPCHRLDVGTGGLLLVAKTREAAAGICLQLRERRVRKVYTAVVVGNVMESLTIDTPLNGLEAKTLCVPIKIAPSVKFGHLSLVELSPLTGRRHQLRKHMAGLGMPILGDKKYRLLSLADKCDGIRGLYLWATELALRHPVSGKDLHVIEEPPRKFTRILEREERFFNLSVQASK